MHKDPHYRLAVPSADHHLVKCSVETASCTAVGALLLGTEVSAAAGRIPSRRSKHDQPEMGLVAR